MLTTSYPLHVHIYNAFDLFSRVQFDRGRQIIITLSSRYLWSPDSVIYFCGLNLRYTFDLNDLKRYCPFCTHIRFLMDNLRTKYKICCPRSNRRDYY